MCKNVVEIKVDKEKPLLTTVALSLTNRCNLRCKHCSVNAGEKISEEISHNIIIKALNEALDLGLIFIPISGGEPLIREDIMEILREVDVMGIQTMLNTNGLLVTEKILKGVVKLRNFGGFSISLDGATKESHEYFRGKGTFSKTISNIKLLTKKGIGVGISCVLHRLNFKEVKDVINLADELKVGAVRFLFLAPIGRGNSLKNLVFSTEEKQAVVKEIVEYIVNYKPNVRVYMNVPPALIPPQHFEKVRDIWRFTTGCFIGFSQLHILPNGDVYPCFNFSEYASTFLLGNIKKDSIKSIWRDSKILKQFRNALKVRELTGVCSECRFKENCRGFCPADKFRLYGKLNAPNPLCQDLYQRGLFYEEYIKG
jgi:radical SAM protein with 4Fe4S-binding SPASM domain